MRDKIIENVRAYAIEHTKMGADSIHGIDHWDRVARNGESLNVLRAIPPLMLVLILIVLI